MKRENIKMVYVAVEILKANEYNPRRITEKQEHDLTESIKKFGLVDPIIVNKHKGRENVVIGGHQRLKMCKKAEMTQVPVVYLDLDLEAEKELNLRLNANSAEWDYEKLLNFDIDLLIEIGFDDQFIQDIWDDQLEIEDDDFDVAKELEKIKETDIKTGDMFQLGNSRLICGDSTDTAVIKKLVGEEKIDMVYTDPVYNINLNYDKGIGGKGNYGGNVNDNKSKEEYKAFLKQTMENALLVTKPNAHIFYYCDQRYIGLVQELYEELGIKHQRVCLWVKNGMNLTPQVAFNKAYEPCVYGVKGKPYLNDNLKNLNEILNKNVGTGNRTAEDIMDMIDIWLVKRLPGNQYSHATEKPVELHEKPLRRCTRPGQNVLDFFGGSGSTLFACEQMKRRAFLVEINPIFIQLIINRYEQQTNTKVIQLN